MTANFEAIVLGGEDAAEHDRRITLYTRERGRLDAFARGAKKRESKLAAHLEPFITTEVFIVDGLRGAILAGSVVKDARLALRSDVNRLALAGALVRLVNTMAPFENKEEDLFNLLNLALTVVDQKTMSIKEQSFFMHTFAWKLLALAGYKSELKHCSKCRRAPLSESMRYHARLGGVAHEKCLSNDFSLSISLSMPAIKGLWYLISSPIEQALRLRGSEEDFEQIKKAIELSFEERFDIEAGSDFWQYRI